MKAMSSSDTLLVFTSVRRPKSDDGPFFNELSKAFEMKLLPQSLLHPAFCEHGVGSYLIHVLRRKGVGTATMMISSKRHLRLAKREEWRVKTHRHKHTHAHADFNDLIRSCRKSSR